MSCRQVKVEFGPRGRSVYVLPGSTILEAGARAGLMIRTPCGGQGACGRCRVRVRRSACEPTAAERRIFSDRELADGWRLACQTRICDRTVISVPTGSLFGDQHQILTEARLRRAGPIEPAVRKVCIRLPREACESQEALRGALAGQLGLTEIDADLIEQLPGRVRASGGQITAVLANGAAIGFEQSDTTARCYGAAFDLGTTTIVGVLLDLATGDELAVASTVNPQTRFGDDVVSRIRHARTSPDHAKRLGGAAASAVDGMIEELCRTAGVRRREVYEITLAGNTTMQHLLCGLDVARLGELPFTAACEASILVGAGELGISIHRRGLMYVFPVIGGFVGGDTVAGLLAAELPTGDGATLMIDIGTNGEIVLAHNGSLLAASTAAGPAFEGARISCGMAGTNGAIEKVVFDDDVRVSVIGDIDPVGICGSGLVDLVAALLDAGIVDASGRMRSPKELPDSLPAALRNRIGTDESGATSFVIADGGSCGPAVVLRQGDVREVQLAAGAIRAGIRLLMDRAALAGDELSAVLVAGGFGSFIRRSNAQRIGLLPAGIAHERIHYVGNTSLAGAKWALLSTAARRRAERIAEQVRHVDLSSDPRFQAVFAESMIFPSS